MSCGLCALGPPNQGGLPSPEKKYKRADLAGGDRFWAGTHTMLHRDALRHKPFYTQTLLHTKAFTHRHFYTDALLHANTFTHKHLYTETLLHTNPFTKRHFYTQKL